MDSDSEELWYDADLKYTPPLYDKFIEYSKDYYFKCKQELKDISKKEKRIYEQHLKLLRKKYKFMYQHKVDKRNCNEKEFKALYNQLVEELKVTDKSSEYYIPNINLHLITNYLQNKVVLLKKHAQSGKTYLCISEMINTIENGNTCICITKNTLDANEQWTKRAIDNLKTHFPNKELNEFILIISSKQNTLNGYATHCKDINEAKVKIFEENFKLIFVCSNKTQIEKIYNLINSPLNKTINKTFVIQYDEAHNRTEGIPAHKILVENIIMTPSLYRIIVCTATDENIWDESDALEHNIFKKSRCISNSYDFTQIDKIKSNSDNYSSISDAIPITYEKRPDSKRNYKFLGLRNNRFEIEDLLGEE